MPNLHSNILGEGQPLLVLHGFLGMSDNWKTLGSEYAENGYEVHLIDQRNHGKSFWSDEFDYSLLAEDLKDYMDDFQIEKATLLGHSMGGKTVMQFACTYPQRVRKLIVADISPKFYPPHHQYIIDALLALPLDQVKSRSEADSELAKHLNDWGIRQFLLKSLHWVEKGRLSFRFNLKVLATKMEEIGDSISGSDSYKGPTLFLRGSRSEYISEQDLPMIKQHFPSAVLETVPDSGHWLHAENPEEFMKLSLQFLNR
ncbi:alpha/beta fold hydrolase [Muriicola soli]|uniref:Alpha/beta fold hydrolase n=1 Tax=Muriicola soli TaxID=2507538 RepID=A0A411ED11_9FLAO|nr:alpha/beta fold hydrolase [Muriicola soli]QBA65548.1 alpha/beta fold hydrolase [Muriicola soli]